MKGLDFSEKKTKLPWHPFWSRSVQQSTWGDRSSTEQVSPAPASAVYVTPLLHGVPFTAWKYSEIHLFIAPTVQQNIPLPLLAAGDTGYLHAALPGCTFASSPARDAGAACPVGTARSSPAQPKDSE